MRKRMSTLLLTGVLLLGGTATALASSSGVIAGRGALFNNGSPTYSGILTANTTFAAAVQSDPGDREARLFAALTRIVASALSNGPGSSGITTLRDLMESFALTRNGNDTMLVGPPFDPMPDLNGNYNPPATLPTVTEASDFLAGPLVTLLDASLADLDVIINATTVANPFVLTLTATETGDLPVEIDLGDVLAVKAMLCTLKAQALILHAWDMDSVDLRQLFILANANVLQLQRDLLDKYQNLLKLNSNASATMTQAKAALLLAISTSQAAYDAISAETDDQTDDMFTFADQQEMDDAKANLDILAEVKASIDENRPAILGEEEWVWWTTDGMQHHLWLQRDSSGAIVGGSTDFGWAIDPATSQTNGTSFTINAPQTVQCVGSWQLSGDVSGTTLSAVNGVVTGCEGLLDTENYSNANGVIEIDASATVDFNVVFGKSGQLPLEVRTYLPTFRADDTPIFGNTTSDPTFGGFWPNLTLNDLDSEEIEMPEATITIDGSASDWEGIPSMTTDADYGNTPPAAIDIQKVFMAKDANYLYWMVETAAPPTGQAVTFAMTINKKATLAANNHFMYATLHQESTGSVSYALQQYDNLGNLVELSTSSADATIGSVVEGRIPLDQFLGRTMVMLSGNAWQTDAPYGYDSVDDDVAMLLPTTTVSGEIQYNPYVAGTDVSQTIIKAFNEANPLTGAFLGSAVVNGVGAYSIPGLPIGKPIYLFALGDTDSNGIRTWVDYAGSAGPVTPQADGESDQTIPIQQPTPPETTFATDIVQGWNLLHSTVSVDVSSTLGMNTAFKSIWKWEGGTWAVHVPGGDQGKAYAQSKKFGFLTTIQPGEGFWVNSTITTTGTATGTPLYGPITLTPGWNLIGLKTQYPLTAASIAAEQSGVTSIWKWENGTWSVALPGEEVPGAYVASKNYGMLTTINPHEGFWVNQQQ